MIFKLTNTFSLDDKFIFEFGGTVDDILHLLEDHLKNPINVLHLLNCYISEDADERIVEYLVQRAKKILYINNLKYKYMLQVGNSDDYGEPELLYDYPSQDTIIDKIRDLVSDDWSPQYDADCIVDAYNRSGEYYDTRIEIVRLPSIEHPVMGLCKHFMDEIVIDNSEFDDLTAKLKWNSILKAEAWVDELYEESYRLYDDWCQMLVVSGDKLLNYNAEGDNHLVLIEGIMNDSIQLIVSIEDYEFEVILSDEYRYSIDKSDLGILDDDESDEEFESDESDEIYESEDEYEEY